MLALLLITAAATTIAAKDPLLDFSYKWSAEAAAVPALDRRFRADAANQRRRYTGMARQDRAERLKDGSRAWDVPYGFERSWTTAGRTARLLSLSSNSYVFSGGAHGNSNTKPLLWDLRSGREVTLDALLQRPGWWDGAIRQPFCILLRRERAKRLPEPVQNDIFSQCPPLKDVSLVLTDTNKNRRFDHVLVTADPYVAGSYAEGSYAISLPLTATMIARLKPEYRASFEAQPPVQ